MQEGVAAADAHRVQFPWEQKDWYPAGDGQAAGPMHTTCGT